MICSHHKAKKRQSQGFHPYLPSIPKPHGGGSVKAVKRTSQQSTTPGVGQAASKGRLTSRLPPPEPRCRGHLLSEGRDPVPPPTPTSPQAHARRQRGFWPFSIYLLRHLRCSHSAPAGRARPRHSPGYRGGRRRHHDRRQGGHLSSPSRSGRSGHPGPGGSGRGSSWSCRPFPAR